MIEAVRAFDADDYLGETPIWSARDQSLWWVNCEQPPAIHRWSPTTGDHRRWEMPNRVGGLVHKASGGLLVVLADGLYDFDPGIGSLELRLASGLPADVMLHECHCDRQGRFWVGAYDHQFLVDRASSRGAWFRLDGDKLTPVVEGIAVANGLAFSPDGRTMYAADSGKRAIDAFDLDPATGALANRRHFITVDPADGFLDGATVDADGGYWLALVGTGEVRRYTPNGIVDRIIPVPLANPTKPAFGGPDMATLYLTSTKLPINPASPKNDGNGAIWSLTPGGQGVPEIDFVG